MSLPHILLGMLAEPATGYDLKQKFETSIQHFWSAELSQIYPTLSKLEKAGHLTSRREPSDKGPTRKVYARTEAGREELVDWLAAGPDGKQERILYLGQVFFLAEVDHETRITFFSGLRDGLQSRLDGLRSIESQWATDDPRYPDDLPDEDFYPQLTLRMGLMKYAVLIEWCEECLRRIEARATAATRSP